MNLKNPLAKLDMNEEETKRFQLIRLQAMADMIAREKILDGLGFGAPDIEIKPELSDIDFLLSLIDRVITNNQH